SLSRESSHFQSCWCSQFRLSLSQHSTFPVLFDCANRRAANGPGRKRTDGQTTTGSRQQKKHRDQSVERRGNPIAWPDWETTTGKPGEHGPHEQEQHESVYTLRPVGGYLILDSAQVGTR